MKEEIWVIGPPKAGNTWLSRLLGEILNSPVLGAWGPKLKKRKTPPASEGDKRPGKYLIIQDHLTRKPADFEHRSIFIYRDPRDIVVSAKFYWKMETFNQAIEGVINSKWPYNYRLKDFLEYWIMLGNADTVISFEQIKKDGPKQLLRILDEINVKPVKDIEKSIKVQSFGIKKKKIAHEGATMPYGTDIQNSMLRKGIVGDWKNHLSQANAKRIHLQFYLWMVHLGYENDPKWWEKVKKE